MKKAYIITIVFIPLLQCFAQPRAENATFYLNPGTKQFLGRTDHLVSAGIPPYGFGAENAHGGTIIMMPTGFFTFKLQEGARSGSFDYYAVDANGDESTTGTITIIQGTEKG